MEKTVLSIVLQIAIWRVSIFMEHVEIVRKVWIIIAPKVIPNDLPKMFVLTYFFFQNVTA